MHGRHDLNAPKILVRSLAVAVPRGAGGELWQYHSRSDLHSKVACWGVLFDLMSTSGLLQQHIADGKVAFGVNHTMADFVNNRMKKLDLVLARPDRSQSPGRARTFADLADEFKIQLETTELAALAALPVAVEAPVGAVLMALEAKACMTEHVKSLPRLYDELNSSHQVVHAASNQALAVGFTMVNLATEFASPDRNRGKSSATADVITKHRQPDVAIRAIERIKQLPRRTSTSAQGYDGLAIAVIEMENRGGSVELTTGPPAPPPGDIFHYDAMITRVANEYDSAFRRL